MKTARTLLVLLLCTLLLAAPLLSGCTDARSPGADGGPSAESTTFAEDPGDVGVPSESGSVPDDADAPSEASPEPKPEAGASSAIKARKAKVVRIVDGDTAVLSFGGTREKVRFIGVDTPESTIEHEPYGKEAAAYTRKQLTGRTVWVETDVEKRDRYGRLLGYIWLAQPKRLSDAEIRTKLFNARLMIGGYAQMMTYPPNVKYVDYYLKYQREARSKNRGLWAIPVAGSRGSSASGYVGSSRSNKFHYPSCRWAKRISDSNLVRFKTRKAALDADYVPCKVCDP
ncbi:MAG: thermonuclease family protein [Coriobacteriales bacterium]|nr:thermonuclease family protein [Coriobacteriales bacterium]